MLAFVVCPSLLVAVYIHHLSIGYSHKKHSPYSTWQHTHNVFTQLNICITQRLTFYIPSNPSSALDTRYSVFSKI